MMEELRKHKGFLLFEGILFMIFGILAIIIPAAATLTIELVIGWLILFSGILQFIMSFRKGKPLGIALSLLSSILSVVVGILLLRFPLTGVLTLTVLLAVFFIIEGVLEIALGLHFKEVKNWFWFLVSGITAIFIAVIIWSGWPGTAAWALGLLVGINLIFFGASLISISAALPKSS